MTAQLFKEKVRILLTTITQNPSLLEAKQPEMKNRLDKCCGNGQGLGNKSSDQEACFAVVLEEQGWIQLLPGDKPNNPFSYIYQAQGTQRSIDFQLVSLNSESKPINFDLKHGEKEGIFLNDGKFLRDVIYVISFTRLLEKVKGQRKCPRQNICSVALGQDIMTEKDSSALEKRYAQLREMNEQAKDTDFLTLYARNANQYSCKQFTSEFNTNQFKKVLEFLA